LYGAGCCLFHPNFQPLLANATPADRLGRVSGYASSAAGVALVVAAPVGVLLVGAGPLALWLALILCCAAVVGLARRVGATMATEPAVAPEPLRR
jgi:MFS family permease